jgi:membrane protein DedA with SNARE-associated domain
VVWGWALTQFRESSRDRYPICHFLMLAAYRTSIGMTEVLALVAVLLLGYFAGRYLQYIRYRHLGCRITVRLWSARLLPKSFYLLTTTC